MAEPSRNPFNAIRAAISWHGTLARRDSSSPFPETPDLPALPPTLASSRPLAAIATAAAIAADSAFRGRLHQDRRELARPAPHSRAIRIGMVTWALVASLLAGCRNDSTGGSAEPELIYGRQGISDGRFTRPRSIAIDAQDRIYIVDFTARIQVFDRDGKFLRGWRTPKFDQGKPTGLSIDRQGRLMVADTHCARVLFYTPEGELLPELTIGGEYGPGPGQFHFVTDVVEDSQGNFYVAEYGEMDRIQKFSPDRKFLFQWGEHGDQPGQMNRPQALAIDEHDQLWVADSCNHRIQVFHVTGEEPKLVQTWGEHGSEPGQMNYPYGMYLDGKGHVYVTEFGNHRVQKFTLDGKSLGTWGAVGRGPGQLSQPWSSAMDSRGDLHVLDSYNHRVQKIRL